MAKIGIRARLTIFSCSMLTGIAGAEPPNELIDAGREILNTKDHDAGVHKIERAIALLEKQIAADPDGADLHYQLGRACYFLERDDTALREFDRAIALDPKHSGAYFFKGVILRLRDDADQASKALQKACALDPENSNVWTEYGLALLDVDDKKEARRAFEKALRANDRNSQALFQLSIFNYEDGNHALALDQMRKSIEIAPEAIGAHYNLGQWYQLAGENKMALEQFRDVVRLDPDDERALAKVVQCSQALHQSEERDDARRSLQQLHKAGKTKAEFFCREQFGVGDFNVMVFEYFELNGDEPVRYSFQVLRKGRQKPIYRISLGSYDLTNEFFHAKGDMPAAQRVFHLDRYFPTGKHETFAFYRGEPAYDVVRPTVIEIIKGTRKPTSSMTPTSQGATIELSD